MVVCEPMEFSGEIGYHHRCSKVFTLRKRRHPLADRSANREARAFRRIQPAFRHTCLSDLKMPQRHPHRDTGFAAHIVWRPMLVVLACVLTPVAPLRADDAAPPADRAQLKFFEQRVRPLLANHCYKCHGAKKQSGGLRLDGRRAMLAGGDSGPAVTPGDPEDSLLVEAVNYASFEMPPTGKLNQRDIDTLTRWVKIGAPWPAEDAAPGASPRAIPANCSARKTARSGRFSRCAIRRSPP